MSSPVVSLRTIEKIGRISNVLEDEETSHNGFPVVEDYEPEGFDKVRCKNVGFQFLFEIRPLRKPPYYFLGL